MNRTPLATLTRRLKIAASHELAGATDGQLLARYVSESDQAAFAELVRRHERTVLAACRQVLADAADVEDAFQATFLVLVQQAKRVRCPGSLGGWLFAVAHRVAVRATRTRARKTRRENAARVAPASPETGAELSWREAVAALHEELDALPDRFRLPVILCYLDGLSRDEAAARLGWKAGSVKAGLERGRERLRARLERRGVTLSAGLLTALAGLGSVAGASPPLLEATLRTANGGAPSRILELARPTMTAVTTKAKLLIGPVLAAACCVGLLAAGGNTPPSAARAEPPATANPRTETRSAPTEDITGRVTGPDGKAVAGAKIYTIKGNRGGPERVEVATTAADGTFRTPRPTPPATWAVLFAHNDGFGLAWHDFEGTETAVELKLVADHPITGRVIDTEGKPVAGARVTAGRISIPRGGNMDAALEAMKSDPFGAHPAFGASQFHGGWSDGVGSVTTDADGKFTLTGCGVDRVVELTVTGDGLARKSLTVINRAKFDPGPINAAAEASRRDSPSRPNLTVYGPEVQVVAERAKTVEGIVIDAATKKPIAGATVSDYASPVRTDAEGRFKISSLRKAKQYSLWVGGPADGDYLARSFRIDDTEGFTPVKCEIELRRGVVVTGRVIDKATGKPVRAGVQVYPIAGNKFYAEYYSGVESTARVSHLSDADGKFRVVTVPGQLIVTVQGHEFVTVGDAKLMPFRGAGPDPDHPDLFDAKIQTGYTFVQLADRSWHTVGALEHGVRIIDVPAEGKPFEVNFALDRGVTGRIRIEGPDGKPVTGTTILGLAHASTPATPQGGTLATSSEATVTVLALDPKAAPRQIIAWHSEKKLGGMATIRGDEKEPVVVKVAPLADITGKFVTADGKPVAGASVLIDAAEEIEGMRAFLSLQFGVGSRSRVRTAADGSFTIPGLIPGVEYTVRMVKDKNYFPRERGEKPPTAKPEAGKLTDLGTIDVGTMGDG
jgi:RNA polymerase sigma factor (sigma-70 family)